MHPKYTPEEVARFWSRVDKTGDCWLWTGPTNPKYGVYVVSGQEREYAHRYSWVAAHGPIAEGLFVLHRCDTPRCVRPSHLWLGTHDDNMRDMVEKGRSASGDRNPSRAHNEAVQRGDQHWSHRHPEQVKRGDDHPARTRPDYLPRGAAHWTQRNPEARQRGEAHPNTTLTTDQVREIRARYAAGGVLQRELTAEFGISRGALYDILKRRTWGHVE